MACTVSAVTLGVTDINRAKDFYGRGLGCTIEQEAEGFAALRLRGVDTTIGLYSRDSLAADAGVPSAGKGFRATALSFIVERADEVDALVGCARAAGGTVVKPPRGQLWGGYSGYVADPDGHLWKVGSNHRPSIFRGRTETPASPVPPAPTETAVTLACRDINQSKAFYSDGLGFDVEKSYSKFVSFKHGEASMMLSLYEWDALADDAGVDPNGAGFRAMTMSCIVPSAEHVDELLRGAAKAGATPTEPTPEPWGGYSGHFTDPSGHLWKVAAA